MRCIIAGSRDILDPERVFRCIEDAPFRHQITRVVSGRAPGVDTIGEKWAALNNLPVDPYPADWDTHGRSKAGKMRNQQMANNADALICVHKGTPGSRDMMKRAVKSGLLLHLVFLVGP